jgi:hypothetical protein
VNLVKWALVLCGAVLTISGSFLPWSCQGDLVWYCTPGMQLTTFSGQLLVRNDGGLSIIVLSCGIFMGAWCSARVRYADKLVIASAITLTIIVLYRVISTVAWQISTRNVIGGLTIQSGLYVVLLGTVLLFVTSIWYYRTKNAQRNE